MDFILNHSHSKRTFSFTIRKYNMSDVDPCSLFLMNLHVLQNYTISVVLVEVALRGSQDTVVVTLHGTALCTRLFYRRLKRINESRNKM